MIQRKHSHSWLLLLPQRYEFSSKSQPEPASTNRPTGCCCYRKGTNFQANHNSLCSSVPPMPVVVATAKVRIFKQITTRNQPAPTDRPLLLLPQRYEFSSKSQLIVMDQSSMKSCCCYRKGTNFQANHNNPLYSTACSTVVVATAKVRIFKQITTNCCTLQFSPSCCCYRKGTNFQANHNLLQVLPLLHLVVVATAKVRIFKQITTAACIVASGWSLLLLPQRYEFSSKSQLFCSLS